MAAELLLLTPDTAAAAATAPSAAPPAGPPAAIPVAATEVKILPVMTLEPIIQPLAAKLRLLVDAPFFMLPMQLLTMPTVLRLSFFVSRISIKHHLSCRHQQKREEEILLTRLAPRDVLQRVHVGGGLTLTTSQRFEFLALKHIWNPPYSYLTKYLKQKSPRNGLGTCSDIPWSSTMASPDGSPYGTRNRQFLMMELPS